MLLLLLLPACGPLTFTIGSSPDRRLQSQIVASEGAGRNDRIALVDVTGLIVNADRPGLLQAGDNPVGLLTEKLEVARQDKRVKAVILRINSPGGTVTATDMMYGQVVRFRRETGKPVIVLMMDVAASGGYYLACAGDYIVAYPTTVTGSIGVIVQTITVKEGLDRIGVRAEAITSGPNKNVGSPLSTMTPEHRAILQHLVDDFYERFVGVVRQRRLLIPPGEFARLTDGRVMSGREAATVGLVDEVGDLHDAVALAKQRAGLKRVDLIMYHRPMQYVGSPYAASPAPPAHAAAGGMIQINLAQINLPDLLADTSARFYYLWQADR
ncbi:MAG: signal peptide peptidase SppA [Phycisphaeraceae bacterium]